MEYTNNNFKHIRELYGATQEEISKIVGVNRATISQWERGAARASSASLEKLSIFYGIGPEVFYEIAELDDERKQMIINTAQKAKMIEAEGERNKVEDFQKLFQEADFKKIQQRFMMSMKLVLAIADHAEKVEDLQVTYDITIKMAERLRALIEIRVKEEEAKKSLNEETLFDLLDRLSEE